MIGQLGLKRAQEEARGSERENVWQKQREKMTTRAARLRSVLTQDLAKAQKSLAEFDVKFTECASAWTAEDKRKSDHHDNILAEWDLRMKELNANVSPDGATPAAAAPGATPVSSPMELEMGKAEKDYSWKQCGCRTRLLW